jgi:nucleoside-diphosphate-sugar epimerase
MECLVKTWFERLPIIITRPFNYTGVGQHPNFLVPKIVAHFCQHKSLIELGNLDVARDFSDVRDIATAYLKLFEIPHTSEIVNLCSGQVTALADIIQAMNAIAGYDIAVQVNPAFVRSNEIKILGGDNRKLKNLTDFVPTIPLTQTLQAMYLAGQSSDEVI